MSTWRMRRMITVNAKAAKTAKVLLCVLSALCVQCTIHVSYASIYLHDEGSREGAPARYQSPRRHLALVLLRRQDRRARPERRGEELAVEDHGRRRHEFHRRGVQGR